jgi:monoamine oxidase
MSRTPLFAALRQAAALAAASRDGPPMDELAAPGFRRRTLLTAAAALAAAPAFAQAPARAHAKVVVAGAGLAGLVAAHTLVAAGVRDVTIIEANRRIGGRVLSGRDVVGAGTLVELGGSFINTEHADMLALCRQFDLALEDGTAGEDGSLSATWWIGGSRRTLPQIAEASRELVAKLEAIRALPGAEQEAHDRDSAAALLDRLGVSGWLRTLLDVGLAQEMGTDPDRMSALYLIEAFAPDPQKPKRGLFSSDQRFQVAGGNDRLPAALAATLEGRIRTSAPLVAVRPRGRGYTVVAGGREIAADVVILTLPPRTLQAVDITAPLSPLTRRAIRELQLGTNAKLFAGLSARPWRAQGYTGECLNDLGFQTVWEDHGKPGTGAGTATIFAGGRVGLGFRDGTPRARVTEVAQRLDTPLAGAAAAFTGAASRMHWPSNPFVGGSYSCVAPGQWTGFVSAWEPAGNIFFAGEHTSEDYSGYMNGGAESGRKAAEAVLAKLGSRRTG